MRITTETINMFPVGTKVHFKYGVHGIENGEVIGHGSDQFYPAFLLIAKEGGSITNTLSIEMKEGYAIGCYVGHSEFAHMPDADDWSDAWTE